MNIKADVFIVPEKKWLRGRANITINEMITIDGFSIWENKKNELYIKSPERQGLSGEYEGNRQLAFPITKELREQIEKLIFTEYENVKKKNDDIEVEVYISENDSNILANATVKIGDFVIKDFRLTETKDKKKRFVTFPQFKHEDESGEVTYKEIVHSYFGGLKNIIKNKIEQKYEEAKQNKDEDKDEEENQNTDESWRNKY